VREFGRLYAALDETNRTTEKVAAMVTYFSRVPAVDAAWAVYFLSGSRPKRLIPVRRLATWAMQEAGVPEWLFDACYEAVGDLAETIAHLLPASSAESPLSLHQWVTGRLLPLASQDEAAQRAVVIASWHELHGTARFVWNKLLTGAFRVGVSQQLVVRALSKFSGVDEATVAHRLGGHWTPSDEWFTALVTADTSDADRSRPYPFYLAYPLEGGVESLGERAEWQLEWKWDGIRAQLIRRDGKTWIWSRGGELVTERFPELAAAGESLPDGTVLDGEIMPWKAGHALPFAQLQRRIGRLKLTPKVLSEVPVVLIAYDILERDGADLRGTPLHERRAQLAVMLGTTVLEDRIIASPVLPVETWAAATAAQRRSREMLAEGLMLKHRDSEYGVGRRKGGWWKWKVDAYSVDAVMIYAQAGHGRRASLHTDYTFGVWDGDVLVPFAKAYSGLTDAEIRTLDNWIRRHTLEKFGPVRRVEPVQVFELGFEGIQRSTRHKSGVAVRFPRILRWRTDKPAAEADHIEALRALLEAK
jgi:DNA ligase 1